MNTNMMELNMNEMELVNGGGSILDGIFKGACAGAAEHSSAESPWAFPAPLSEYSSALRAALSPEASSQPLPIDSVF